SSALPKLGGYYEWVREAMGEFWGFQEGWWSWLFTWVDMPLYPALCGELLRTTWPIRTGHALSHRHVLLFVIGFIVAGALVNCTGTKAVANYAVLAMVAVMAPFLLFVAVAWRLPAAPAAVATTASLGLSGWALGLSTLMWNYAGWDNVSTFAPAVERPSRTYPRALLFGVGLIALSYLLPVLAGLHIDAVASHWENGYFISLGARALGARFGLLMAFTAVLSAWSQFTAQLPYVLPLPVSLARAGYLPQALTRMNRAGVAMPALILCTLIYCLFALAAFASLVGADALLYSAGLALEFAALVKLRRRRASSAGAFRVPGGALGLGLVCALPMALAAATLAFAIFEEPRFTLVTLAMLATGPLAYAFANRARVKRGDRMRPAQVGSA
ncbi:MAG TPA: APC family permease, partial [Terriglobales bacterium]|nr:APC family permease [Terriglobales bacterium]